MRSAERAAHLRLLGDAAGGAHSRRNGNEPRPQSGGQYEDGDGYLQLADVLAAEVNVSLGTDGAPNNNTHDMFGEMKAACLLQNATRRSASAITA
jgi:hypothetical protein